MLTVTDSIILICLLFGALIGFKRGIIKSFVSFAGILIVLVLSFQLKNSVASWMYTNLPFFNFSGDLSMIPVLNVLVYEAIAFLLLFSVLWILLRMIVVASGIVEKLLRLTIVFGFFSKLLGLIFGFIESYILIFAALFILQNFSTTSSSIEESKLATSILTNTPILKEYSKTEFQAYQELLDLNELYKNDKEAYNKNAFEILVKYGIISTDDANVLLSKNKLNVDNALEIINKYKS